MPFDGSGNFVRTFPPGGWQGDANAAIKIRADRHDQHDQDLASGLSLSLTRDGQSSPTADINWNGKKITNLSAGINATDAINKGQLDAIRSFSTGITLPGAGINNRLEYTQADMSFFVRSIGDPAAGDLTPRFVWNDKADGTGMDLMTFSDASILRLLRKDDGAGYGPDIVLMRDSASPAVSDYLGRIIFSGKDGSGAETQYADLSVQITDPTNNSEDCGYVIRTLVAGAMVNKLVLNATGASFDGALATTGGATIGGSGTFSGGLTASALTTSSTITSGQQFTTTTNEVILGPGSGGLIYLRPNGTGSSTREATLSSTGAFRLPGTSSSSASLFVDKATGGNYSVDARGATSSAAVIGFCNNTSYYGLLGYQDPGGSPWSFYGTGNALINGGTWQTSDSRFKDVTGTTDGAAALANVMAVPIKTYKPAADGAAALGLEPGEEVIGWLAQDVEPVVPSAVKTVRPPPSDLLIKTTYKATNDHTMLATLWAAVQELTAQVESLKAQLAGAP